MRNHLSAKMKLANLELAIRGGVAPATLDNRLIDAATRLGMLPVD